MRRIASGLPRPRPSEVAARPESQLQACSAARRHLPRIIRAGRRRSVHRDLLTSDDPCSPPSPAPSSPPPRRRSACGGGSGPPLLLLHGHPQTHVMWHLTAPQLAEAYTVVCADLRGYGDSAKVPTTADHEPYSKRAMARDMVAAMRALGHERF